MTSSTITNVAGLQADRMHGLVPSEIRKALLAAGRPGLISLAGGVPAAGSFPVERYRAAFDRILRDDPSQFLQYGRIEGYGPLRELAAERMARFGARYDPGQVLVTSGSQQGIDLVGRLLLNVGDQVVVESPSYLGALETFRQYQVGFVVVPPDDEGIRTDLLEEHLRRDRGPGGPRRIRLLYTMPNFANPSGATMGLARRRALVELAARFRLPVVEDDAYGELRFDGARVPSLSSFDTAGLVFSLGSLSKVLSPGLRIGWLASPAAFVLPVESLKERCDLHSPHGPQMATVQVMADGFLDAHLRDLRALYRARRDAMLAAIEAEFPPMVRHARPEGGFFVWCTLPAGVDAAALLPGAARRRVAFVPGAGFHAGGGRADTMRLSFSGLPPDLIREGVARLGSVLKEAL